MDLLCVVARSDAQAEERLIEARAVSLAQGRVENGRPVSRDNVRAVAYRRLNGSGAPVAEDIRTGSWILAAGTWFHKSGFASGAEGQLLERVVKFGIETVAGELEGFFTIIAYDALRRVVSVVTDICGTCHVFARVEQDTVVISGSALVLAALGDAQVDPVGAQEFLYTGVLYEGRTTHKQVRKLPGSSIISWDPSLVIHERRYWTIADIRESSLDGEKAITAVSEALVGAASRIEKLFSRPAADLTGGRDSRLIAAAMIEARAQFTAVVCGPESNRDVIVSKQIAKALGIAHLHIPADELATLSDVAATVDTTDGEYDCVEYSRVERIHRSLATVHDVSLNGTFGEVARGHWLGRILYRGDQRRLDPEAVGPLRFVTQPWDPSIVPPGARIDLPSHFSNAVSRANEGLASRPETAQMQNLYLMMRLQHWFGRIASSTDKIWPTIAPWYLRSVLETVLAVSPGARRNGLLVKQILGRLNPRLARIPLENGCPAMPLTLRTVPRFWPAPIEFARKGLERLQRRGGFGSAMTIRTMPRRMQLLLGDNAVSEVLDPETMRSAPLFDAVELRRFLAQASKRDFRWDLQWNRLLSLELMIRRKDQLKQIGRDAVRQAPAHQHL